MVYDEQLAARVRVLLKGQRALVGKKMFGGLAYMSQGKLFAGILKDNLVVRVGPDGNDEATHETDGFHGAAHEGLHLCEPRGREDCGAIAQVAHAGADVRLESIGGKTNGRPQRG